MFGVGQCNVIVWYLKKNSAYCFGKIRVVLRKTCKSAVVLKRTQLPTSPHPHLGYSDVFYDLCTYVDLSVARFIVYVLCPRCEIVHFVK